jgi:hypothetical protein
MNLIGVSFRTSYFAHKRNFWKSASDSSWKEMRIFFEWRCTRRRTLMISWPHRDVIQLYFGLFLSWIREKRLLHLHFKVYLITSYILGGDWNKIDEFFERKVWKWWNYFAEFFLLVCFLFTKVLFYDKC